MGNKLVGRKRQVVEERYTKPQGLYVNTDVDIKKLRKLIVESKLAPCYPGDDESCHDLEECPICFLVCESFSTVLHFYGFNSVLFFLLVFIYSTILASIDQDVA